MCHNTKIKVIALMRKKWQPVLLIVFIVLMIIPYCYLSLTTDHKFYSPDETANFVFTKNFIEHGNLNIEVALNKWVDNVIFPRSVNVLAGHFVPMSFLGLPIFYGLIGKIIGVNFITFVTPLLSLIAAFLFYFVIKEIFCKNIAFLSCLFILLNPVYWYLAGKSMLHNNLFLFFVILGLWLLILALKRSNVCLYFISAISFGAGIWTRTSEIVWLGLLMIIFYVVHRKNVRRRDLIIFVIGFCGMLGLLLCINNAIYNNIFRSGYSSLEPQNKISLPSLITQIILPFGFSLKNIIFHVWEFFIKYLWLVTLPAICGFIFFCKKNLTKLQKFYVFATGIISIYLIVYYGSYWPWGAYGQPAEPEILIGGPHFRYWLPILVLLTPFIAVFIVEIAPKLFKTKKVITFSVTVGFLVLLMCFSISNVFYDPQEGFMKIKNDIADFQPRLSKVQQLVESNAVLIIPDWADRIFFPEYQVIHSLGDKAVYAGDVYQEISNLTQLMPIYYYSADSNLDLATLGNKLGSYHLDLEYKDEIFKGEKLYRIIYDARNDN